MFELIENIKLLIQNRDKVALAVLFIDICHMISIVIEYFKREKEEKIVCVVEFKLFVKVQMNFFTKHYIRIERMKYTIFLDGI